MAGYISGIPLTLGAVRGCLLCSCQWELETDLTCRTVLVVSARGVCAWICRSQMVGVALEGAGRGIGSCLSSCTHGMGPNAALSAGLAGVRLVLVCLHHQPALLCVPFTSWSLPVAWGDVFKLAVRVSITNPHFSEKASPLLQVLQVR